MSDTDAGFNEGSQTCSRCGVRRQYSLFQTSAHCINGYMKVCKLCRSEQNAAYRAARGDLEQQRHAAYAIRKSADNHVAKLARLAAERDAVVAPAVSSTLLDYWKARALAAETALEAINAR